jgi:hypothetical protein
MKMNNTKIFLRGAWLLAVAVAWANVAQAQTCSITWTNKAGDFLWSTAGNWSTNQVPGSTDDVCIPSGLSSDARATPSISVNSLQISQNAGVNFGSGTVSIATPVTLQGGIGLFGTTLSVPSVNVQPPASVVTGGSLTGYGTIEGSLTVSGMIVPQMAPITVRGDYTQTSSATLGETWPQTMTPTYGLLQVGGNVTLSGSLYVSTDAPKHPPKTGSTFTVMTFGGSLSGEFTSVNSPISAKYERDSVLAQYH